MKVLYCWFGSIFRNGILSSPTKWQFSYETKNIYEIESFKNNSYTKILEYK